MSVHLSQVFTYLCPAFFPWVDCGPATTESGKSVVRFVALLYILILIFDVIMVYCSRPLSTLMTCAAYLLAFSIIVIIGAISRKPQNRCVRNFVPYAAFTEARCSENVFNKKFSCRHVSLFSLNYKTCAMGIYYRIIQQRMVLAEYDKNC